MALRMERKLRIFAAHAMYFVLGLRLHVWVFLAIGMQVISRCSSRPWHWAGVEPRVRGDLSCTLVQELQYIRKPFP